MWNKYFFKLKNYAFLQWHKNYQFKLFSFNLNHLKKINLNSYVRVQNDYQIDYFFLNTKRGEFYYINENLGLETLERDMLECFFNQFFANNKMKITKLIPAFVCTGFRPFGTNKTGFNLTIFHFNILRSCL